MRYDHLKSLLDRAGIHNPRLKSPTIKAAGQAKGLTFRSAKDALVPIDPTSVAIACSSRTPKVSKLAETDDAETGASAELVGDGRDLSPQETIKLMELTGCVTYRSATVAIATMSHRDRELDIRRRLRVAKTELAEFESSLGSTDRSELSPDNSDRLKELESLVDSITSELESHLD